MNKDKELKNLIDHIPKRSDYPDSKLEISLPTTSKVAPGKVLKVVNSDAVTKGWQPDEITIVRKSGYIACAYCKKAVHIHIASPQIKRCMNCNTDDISRNTAEISIVDE